MIYNNQFLGKFYKKMHTEYIIEGLFKFKTINKRFI